MAEENFMSFDDVMKELNVDAEELKRMISEGQLPAWRSEGKFKMKKDDIDNLKKGKLNEPTVILPSAPGGGTLNIDEELSALGGETTDMAQPTAGGDEVVEESPGDQGVQVGGAHETEEFVLEDDTAQGEATGEKGSDETFVEEPLGESPPVDVGEEANADVDADATIAEGVVEETAPAVITRKRRAMAPQMTPDQMEELLDKQKAHPAWTVVAFFFTLVTLATALVAFDLVTMSSAKVDQPAAMTKGVVRWIVGDIYWKDEKWKQDINGRWPEAGTAKPDSYQTPFATNYDGVTFEKPDWPTPKLPTEGE